MEEIITWNSTMPTEYVGVTGSIRHSKNKPLWETHKHELGLTKQTMTLQKGARPFEQNQRAIAISYIP